MNANLFAAIAHVLDDKDGILPKKILKNTLNAEGVDVSNVFAEAGAKTSNGETIPPFLTSQPR